jgi:hypothetical protein
MPAYRTVPTLSEQAVKSQYELKMETIARIQQLPDKPFGQLDEHAPIGWIPDFFERRDEPQTLDDGHVHPMIQQQLSQDISGGIVLVHDKNSRGE